MRVYLRKKFKWIQVKQIKFVDVNRHSISKFKINDMIMLNVKYQFTKRFNKKFDYKNFESYFIFKAIDNCAYEFKLFEIMKNIFSIFHFWLLHFKNNVSLSNQRMQLSKSTNTSNSKKIVYYFDKITKLKIDKRRNDFVIKTKKMFDIQSNLN